MKRLLFLAHRLPYPPERGDKIRSYHFLRHLTKNYRISLGAFIDDEKDWIYAAHVKGYCDEVELVPVRPFKGYSRFISALFQSQPLSFAYFRDARMSHWIANQLETKKFDAIFVYSSIMAQYFLARKFVALPRLIVDLVDVDSIKWLDYSRSTAWPMRSVYKREGCQIRTAEEKIQRTADAVSFVTHFEKEKFEEIFPEASGKVACVQNGVDLEYFDPRQIYTNPYPRDLDVIVFTGRLDYSANIDAVTWFGREVLPMVQETHKQAAFWIVGANPSREIRKLQGKSGIFVVGDVDDVRPYLAGARIAVAPMRLAWGLPNKILEALAMNLQVAATSKSVHGIPEIREWGCRVADSASEFSQIVTKMLSSNHDREQERRRWLAENYSWDRACMQLENLLAV